MLSRLYERRRQRRRGGGAGLGGGCKPAAWCVGAAGSASAFCLALAQAMQAAGHVQGMNIHASNSLSCPPTAGSVGGVFGSGGSAGDGVCTLGGQASARGCAAKPACASGSTTFNFSWDPVKPSLRSVWTPQCWRAHAEMHEEGEDSSNLCQRLWWLRSEMEPRDRRARGCGRARGCELVSCQVSAGPRILVNVFILHPKGFLQRFIQVLLGQPLVIGIAQQALHSLQRLRFRRPFARPLCMELLPSFVEPHGCG